MGYVLGLVGIFFMDELKKQKARAVFAGQPAILEACEPFDYAQTILHGFGRKNRFAPYKNLPVFTRNDELRGSLGRDSVSLAIDDIVENSTTDFLCIKDHVIPMVARLLSAETFAKEIQECVDNGNFDDNPNVKAEFEILVQFLLGGCHKVGKLLHAELGTIWDQKNKLLDTVVDSMGPNSSKILGIKQRMREIDQAVQEPEKLTNLVGAVQALIGSVDWGSIGPQSDPNATPNATNDLYLNRWLHFCQALQSLQSTAGSLDLEEWFSLNRQMLEITKLFGEVFESFEQIPNLQNQLQELVDRTEDISEDKLEELEVTRQALLRNTNASATDPTTSDTPTQTGWLASWLKQLTGRQS